MTSVSIGLTDINPKKGQVSGHGYGIGFYKDGAKIFRSWEGKAVGKGHMRGVWTIIKGTGKYEGVKVGGTWDSYSLAPQHSYLDVEGEMEMPAKKLSSPLTTHLPKPYLSIGKHQNSYHHL